MILKTEPLEYFMENCTEEYTDFTEIELVFVKQLYEEIHKIKLPTKWLDNGYIAIDRSGNVSAYSTSPVKHLVLKSWDIATYEDGFCEIGTIDLVVEDWMNMLQSIKNARFLL